MKATTKWALALPVIAMLGACGSGNNDIARGLKGSQPIELVQYADTAIMELPSMTKEMGVPSYATVITSAVFPVSWADHNLRPLQDSILSLAYGQKGGTIAEAIKYYITHPAIAEDETDGLKEATELKPDSAMSEQSTVISVKSMSSTLLSFAIFQSNYMYGAAHGMYATQYVNYYVPAAEVLTPDNVFDPGERTNIINTIRDSAREQFASDDTMVDADNIESYENFYVTDQGITFVYAPYEIAPYAAGEIAVEVAPYHLYDYLTPLGKALWGF